MSKTKIAIFGAGDMGKLHLAMYKGLPDVEVAFVVGRDEGKTKEVAEKFGVNWTTNVEKVFSDKTILGIDVCVPTKNHAEIVIPALKAGKNVMCEMPIAFNLKEAGEMVEMAKKYKRVFLVASLMPFVSEIKWVCEKAISGELGKILAVHAYRHHRAYEKTDPIAELMWFEIDTVFRLLGIPKKNETTGKINKNSFDFVSATFLYDNAVATLEMSSIMPNDFSLAHGVRAICEKGILETSIIFPGAGRPQSTTIFYPKNGNREIVEIESENPYKEECRHFVSCLNGKADTNLISGEKALQVLKITKEISKNLKREI